jgi:uncharacterized protein (TIGR03089 family)
VAADPTRPLLTWYDDATGERTELSGATLDNWVAKTANLLVDGCGSGTGDRAAVLLPPHWQTAAVLLGCWAAGLSVVAAGPAEVVFAAADRVADAPDAPDRFVLGLLPMAQPLRAVPDGFTDYVSEVRVHGDRFPGSGAPAGGELVARARSRAADLGLGPDDRVLVDAAAHPDPVDWLLTPFAAGATIVLCGQLDPSRVPARVEAERVTRVW